MIVLSAILLLTQRDAAVERRTTPLLASDIQAPIAMWLGTPFRKLEVAVADVEDSRRALEENKALRAELAGLRADMIRLEAMRHRQKRLEKLLSVDVLAEIPDQRIAVRAVADPSSPFVRSLLIGAGQTDGIAEGYPVLSEEGLVGHVVSAGRHSARVLRLDDLNSRVAVMNPRTEARAILAGENREYATLDFVADQMGWQTGDRVLTSGDDGRLPQGLPVGIVRENTGIDFVVELDFQTRPIDWIFVLPYEPVANDEDLDDILDATIPGEEEAE